MKYLFLFLLSFSSFLLGAQPEHRVAVGKKTIEIEEVDNLMIIGHDEDDLKISRKGGSREMDEKNKGMRKISANGKVDNTGFGLSSQGFDDKVVISQVGKGNGTIILYVPNTAVVKVTQSTHRGGDLEVDNFSGELDVTMMYHKVNLSNVYGPAAVNTVYGGIDATYSSGPPAEDLHLHSTYGAVDITLPKNVKADLRLSTSYGDMYTDFDVEVETEPLKTSTDSLAYHHEDHRSNSRDGLTGSLNGGGTLISLRSTYQDVYLRKLK
ncbi:DUF4097 domain-containing protein [Neolewinella aurantiaca]|uniref:DUF4097 domain-containing protein n=1 Tax=Neolewinella aurantiaca TaxID=2602767 RepID=A0A5C7FWU8_9BACT|nr:DUF4097 family beta strand repeat-containing protein [Neolewinella aurantiaca]TXF90910.1 DUF4097 domain-containing protein [Neolewinella aurantiaca]